MRYETFRIKFLRDKICRKGSLRTDFLYFTYARQYRTCSIFHRQLSYDTDRVHSDRIPTQGC